MHMKQVKVHVLIKKRILMLQKSKLSTLIVLPLLALMLSASSCSVKKSNVDDKGNAKSTELSQYDKEQIKKEEIAKYRKHIKDSLQKRYAVDVRENLNKDVDAVPYSAIDLVPAYKGCDQSLSNEEIKQCTSERINSYANSNFDTKGVEEFAQDGVNRVYVRFTISKEGMVKDIDARASHLKLAEEAKRVVSSLPKMQPGMQDGKPVNVLYSLPIIFQIN